MGHKRSIVGGVFTEHPVGQVFSHTLAPENRTLQVVMNLLETLGLVEPGLRESSEVPDRLDFGGFGSLGRVRGEHDTNPIPDWIMQSFNWHGMGGGPPSEQAPYDYGRMLEFEPGIPSPLYNKPWSGVEAYDAFTPLIKKDFSREYSGYRYQRKTHGRRERPA